MSYDKSTRVMALKKKNHLLEPPPPTPIVLAAPQECCKLRMNELRDQTLLGREIPGDAYFVQRSLAFFNFISKNRVFWKQWGDEELVPATFTHRHDEVGSTLNQECQKGA